MIPKYVPNTFPPFLGSEAANNLANSLPRLLSNYWQQSCRSFVDDCLCGSFECRSSAATDSREGVTDQPRPLMLISIPSDVLVKEPRPLPWVIHSVYIRGNKNTYSSSIIMLRAMSMPLRSRGLPLPPVTQILIELITLLFTGCHSSRYGSF